MNEESPFKWQDPRIGTAKILATICYGILFVFAGIGVYYTWAVVGMVVAVPIIAWVAIEIYVWRLSVSIQEDRRSFLQDFSDVFNK